MTSLPGVLAKCPMRSTISFNGVPEIVRAILASKSVPICSRFQQGKVGCNLAWRQILNLI
jgi:hypothetical protein